jgi:hypothetical protein
MFRLLILIFLLLALFTKAQDSLSVIESEKNFSHGKANCFTIKIPQADVKDVKSDWKKHLHSKSKTSVKETDGEYVIQKSVLPEISSDSLLFFSTVVSNPDNVEVNFFAGNNESEYISSSTNKSTANNINIFLRNFALMEYKNTVNDELTTEKKKLRVMEEGLNQLLLDSVEYEKKIKVNERNIEHEDDEIKTNKKMLDLKSESIDQQQKVLATFLTDSDLKSDEEKKLKSLQKEKKKIQKEIDNLNDDIDEKKNDNKSMRKLIDKNTEEVIPAKKKDLGKQRDVVMNIEEKLKNIR